MNAPLYTTEILRLAASLPEPRVLEQVDGEAEQRSLTCGSIIKLQVQLDQAGRVEAVSQQVHACAFGQASASLLVAGASGKTVADIEVSLAELRAWLSGDVTTPAWPGIVALAPARSRKSRHNAIMLPFLALLAAMAR